MSIIIEEIEGVTVRREVYASNIRIIGNPENTLAGAVLLDLQRLEYHDDALIHTTPLESAGETVGEFCQRAFEINGKTITGIDVMLLIKQYVADLHAERIAAMSVTPNLQEPPDEPA